MFEPTHKRGAPSRGRFATCRSARALSDGVPDILTTRTDNTQTIPETDDEAEKPYLEGLIRQNGGDDGADRPRPPDRLVERSLNSRFDRRRS